MTIELNQLKPTYTIENTIRTGSRPSQLHATGMAAEYLADAYVTVPDAPGLGVDLYEEIIRQNLRHGQKYFGDTSAWNRLRAGFDRVPHD